MKALIVYFSRAGENWFDGGKRVIEKGNTEIAAEFLKDVTGGDLFALKMVHPYSDNYEECCNQALEDQKRNARPELVSLPDIKDYDTIYLGYPIYWSTMPMPVLTFLESCSFLGKTIYPFSTHEGSHMGTSISLLNKVCHGAQIKDALPLPGSLADKSYNRIKNWVESHS